MGFHLRIMVVGVLAAGYGAPLFAQDAYPMYYYAQQPQQQVQHSNQAAPQQLAAEAVGGPYYPPQQAYAPAPHYQQAQPHYADPAAGGQTPEIAQDLRQLNF